MRVKIAQILNCLFLLAFCCPLVAGELLVINTEFFRNMGMFAAANQVLGHLCLYEKGNYSTFSGISVDFGEIGLYYDPDYGPNWWNYYFEPICLGALSPSEARCASRAEAVAALAARRQTPRSEVAAIVEKFVHVKPFIMEKVDDFVDRYFRGLYILGVHYRGADKVESPRLPYTHVIQQIEKNLPLDRPYKIFIATDEALFLEAAQEKFRDQIIHIEAHRSRDREGVHQSPSNPHYMVGEEALIDALLLSKCNLLIRTSSNLSLWSTYFNPHLPVVLLNRRFDLPTIEPE
jgi:hypothetical protein